MRILSTFFHPLLKLRDFVTQAHDTQVRHGWIWLHAVHFPEVTTVMEIWQRGRRPVSVCTKCSN